MKNIIALIILILIGCGDSFENPEIYIQKIPNSSKIICEYSAWSSYSDFNLSGYTVIDSNETISSSKIKESPALFLECLPTADSIEVIKFIKSNMKYKIDKEQKKEYSINEFDIKIKIKEKELYSGASNVYCGLNEYTFKSFVETNDSLFLLEIKPKRDFLPKLPKGKGFKKGNVKLLESENGKLAQIQIMELIEEDGEIIKYVQGSNEIEEIKEGEFIRCIRLYYFDAIDVIYVNEFSDYGIFKKR